MRLSAGGGGPGRQGQEGGCAYRQGRASEASEQDDSVPEMCFRSITSIESVEKG